MIDQFVTQWEKSKHLLEKVFSKKHPENYQDIVVEVIKILSVEDDKYNDPDPERVHEINDGVYQGTLLYVIGAKEYQSCDYWYVKVDYGSCSVCDTLKAIKSEKWDNPPNPSQISDYMALALHIVQGLKKME